MPVIPLVEVTDNDGTAAPMQMDREFPKLNAGVRIGLTVTVNTAVVIHCCGVALGVNVYTAEFWLLTVAGLHVPLIPLSETDGNAGTVPPAQIVSVVPILNTGIVIGVTVTVKLVLFAHWPADGVNVYVPEFWLSTTAGLHVPAIPFVDAPGNAGTALPAQIVSDVPKLNVGVTIGFTVTANVADVAHKPGDGVNVYVAEF